jgi:hypothetical protein
VRSHSSICPLFTPWAFSQRPHASIETEVVKRETDAVKERESSGRALNDLNVTIAVAQTQPHALSAQTDPYVANKQAMRQLRTQLSVPNYALFLLRFLSCYCY